MPAPLLATLCILLVIAVPIVGMLLGWRRRVNAQRHLAGVRPLPPHLTAPRVAVDDAHYVATSVTGHALERIVVPPLGFRGRCVVEVHDEGVALGIAGEEPFLIGIDQLETVAVAQATIDRAVERDGLLVLRWLLDANQSVETYLRIVDPAERRRLHDALTDLLAPSAAEETL